MLLFDDDAFLLHDAGPGHPEGPDRLLAVRAHLAARPPIPGLRRRSPRAATEDEVALVHTREHIREIRAACAAGEWLDPDTHAGPASWEAALRAVGAVLDAADAVVAGPESRAFCLVRPPGHHAMPSRAMGFCLFDNVAIGARYLREAHGIRRVAIVDFDVHHGNGTEEAFRRDPDVLFLSLHRWPFYPGTGGPGPEGRTSVATRNVPLPVDTVPEYYHLKLEEGLREVTAHHPEIVLVSAGFDAHAEDPVGGLGLSTADFGRITRAIVAAADSTARGRVVSVLEGGYSREHLGPCVEQHLRALA